MKFKFKVLLITGVVIAITAIVIACNSGMQRNETDELEKKFLSYSYESKSQDELWDSTVAMYLKGDLWNERDRYDACSFLMVPLHYAFQSENKEYIEQFHNHFAEFIEYGIEEIDNDNIGQRLNNLQYYCLIGQYIALSNNTELGSEGNKQLDYLANYLLEEVERFWLTRPAWQWGREPFEGGMKERILWKLANSDVDYSYYRAIIDEELFVMAIAADLSTYFTDELLLDEIKEVAYELFNQESYFDEEGRWLFQPGVWSDHPDYAYVGYDKKTKIRGKKPIANISTDSSHSHRFPLWVCSFINTYPKESKERDFYNTVKIGLEKQLFDKVLMEPTTNAPYYRLTNFMDGNNGIYRWNYVTSKGDGRGPYELSGTFAIGWWTFLGTERIKEVYNNLYNQFPLSLEAIELYVGPNTSRERNPYITDPDSFFNGYKELLALLASKIK